MTTYYSQHGEDCLLWEFFKDEPPGFYIDVGAFDGKHLSNTYVFELHGWDGICVEPEKQYFELCKKNRNAICVEAACVNSEDITEVELMTLNQGGLGSQIRSSFDKTKHKKRFTFSPQRVPATTLNAILREYGGMRRVDFLSIDVEGEEVNVLKGLDFITYRPRLIVAEANTELAHKELDHFLCDVIGYQYAGSINVNKFYATTNADVERLKSICVDCHLKTSHPVDKKSRSNKNLTVTSKLIT